MCFRAERKPLRTLIVATVSGNPFDIRRCFTRATAAGPQEDSGRDSTHRRSPRIPEAKGGSIYLRGDDMNSYRDGLNQSFSLYISTILPIPVVGVRRSTHTGDSSRIESAIQIRIGMITIPLIGSTIDFPIESVIYQRPIVLVRLSPDRAIGSSVSGSTPTAGRRSLPPVLPGSPYLQLWELS